MKWIYFLFFSWLFVFAHLQAQPNRFISFTVKDGLTLNSVTCIFQDSNGMLWLGTQDGLNSFDGKNFKQYRYSPVDTNTLSDYYVLSIAEDAQGSLWIGTGSGLNKLNKRTGKIIRYYLNPKEKNNNTANYANLLTTPDGGILIRHYSSPKLINTKGELTVLPNAYRNYTFIGYDKEKNLWCINSLRKKPVCLGKDLQATHIDSFAPATTNIIDPNSVRATIDDNSIIWVYSDEPNGHIQFFDTKEKKWLADSIRLPTVINHINITKDVSGWVSTLNGVYIVKDYKIHQHLTYSNLATSGMLPGNILYAYEDRQRNRWIGSAGAGFAYYNPMFENYQITTTGVDDNAVTSFAEINGSKWLGTAEGLFNIKNGTKRHFLKGKRITALTKDKQHNLWVGVKNEGLYILNTNGKLVRHYLRNDTLLYTTNILYLFTDSRGRIFVCTEMGYFVFSDIAHWQPFHQRYKTPATTGWYTLHAFEDKNKNIWLSKHAGIDMLDENLQLKKQILSNHVSSPINRTIITGSTQDKNGNIWIATLRSGIYVYDHKKLQQFTISDGLSSNLIYGIICDNQGKIWVTTTGGMNVYEPTKKRFFSIGISDGLPVAEYILGALYKNEQGTVITGSTRGLISINADKIFPQSKKIEAQISDIRVNEESVDEFFSPFVLQYGYKTCSFELSAKEALQPQNVVYQYRVKEIDDKWNIITSTNPKIVYSSLPFKKMTMEVRAAYSLLDIESAPVDRILFSVKPPFWKTLWFNIIMIIVGLSMAMAVVWQYNKAKYKKKIAAMAIQHELQHERERISRDLHDNIGAYTSALISGINKLKTKADSNPEGFDELNDYAFNIMGYLRETIWVLNTSRLTFTAFTDRYKNYAMRIVRNYTNLSIQFYEQMEQERELTPQLSLNLFRILQEALQNACNHAGASQIQVGFNSNEKLCMWIKDNGSGINPHQKQDGHGLRNMKARATEIGFAINIASEKEVGTTVFITEIVHLH